MSGTLRRGDSLCHLCRVALSAPDLLLINSESSASERTPLLRTSSRSSLRDEPPVPQHGHVVVGMIFFYLGISAMLPWNLLVSLTTFWDYKFSNSTTSWPNSTMSFMDEKETEPVEPLEKAFPAYLAIASNVPGALTTLVHSVVGHKFGIASRMYWSLSVVLGSFLVLLLASLPDSSDWQSGYLKLVLALTVLANIGVNVLQGVIFGCAGRFPSLYVGLVLSGQGMGGVLPVIAAIALTALDLSPPILGPVAFLISLVMLGVAVRACIRLNNEDFFKHFALNRVDRCVGCSVEVSYKDIICRSAIPIAAGFINAFVTLTIFPAFTTLVEPMHQSAWTHLYFTPVFSALLINVGDVSGRALATWLQWPSSNTRLGRLALLAAALLRLGLVPPLLLCNALPHSRVHVPVLIHSDLVFALLVLGLGLSNGYLTLLSMLHAAKRQKVAEEKECASTFMTAAIVQGIAYGSTFGAFWTQWL